MRTEKEIREVMNSLIEKNPQIKVKGGTKMAWPLMAEGTVGFLYNAGFDEHEKLGEREKGTMELYALLEWVLSSSEKKEEPCGIHLSEEYEGTFCNDIKGHQLGHGYSKDMERHWNTVSSERELAFKKFDVGDSGDENRINISSAPKETEYAGFVEHEKAKLGAIITGLSAMSGTPVPKEKRRFSVEDLKKINRALDTFNLGEDEQYFAFLEDEEFVKRALNEVPVDPDKVLTMEHIEKLMHAVEKSKVVSREENSDFIDGYFEGSKDALKTPVEVEEQRKKVDDVMGMKCEEKPKVEKWLVVANGVENPAQYFENGFARVRINGKEYVAFEEGKAFSLSEMADLMEKIEEYVCKNVVVKRKVVDKEWKKHVEILTDQYEYQDLGWEIHWPRLFREKPDLIERFRKGGTE